MKAIRRVLLVLLILFVCTGAFFTACDDDDDDDDDDAVDDDDAADDDDDDMADDDDDAADDDDDTGDDDDDFGGFFPPAPGPIGTYRFNTAYDHFDVPAEVVGEDTTTFPGETYTLMHFGDFSKGGGGAKLWVDLTTAYKPGVKSMEAYDETGTFLIRETFDTVLYLEFDGDVGETKTSTVDGTMELPDKSTHDFQVYVETTLVSLSASTDVPYGTVDDCIQVDVKFSDPGYPTFKWGGDFFFHGQYGFVEAAVFPAYDVVELVSPAK